MEQSVLNAYVELERQIKQLEEQKAMLRDTIQKDLEMDGANTVKTDLATFSIVQKKSWKYSEAIKAKEEEKKIALAPIQKELEEKAVLFDSAIKEIKAQEEENGTAQCEISKSLRVQLTK